MVPTRVGDPVAGDLDLLGFGAVPPIFPDKHPATFVGADVDSRPLHIAAAGDKVDDKISPFGQSF